jgi:hypothetical protein
MLRDVCAKPSHCHYAGKERKKERKKETNKQTKRKKQKERKKEKERQKKRKKQKTISGCRVFNFTSMASPQAQGNNFRFLLCIWQAKT